MTNFIMPTTPDFSSARFGLIANTRTFFSPFDNSLQIAELTGSRWSANYVLPVMKTTAAAEWRAFLTSLLGRVNTFSGFDPRAKTPRGSDLGTPIVSGASQTGISLTTSGWNVGETGLLLPGDYFSVNGELKMVESGTSVDSDSTGLATIQFKPSLRASPPDAASITTVNATTTMRLVDDDIGFWEEGPVFFNFSFSAIETF